MSRLIKRFQHSSKKEGFCFAENGSVAYALYRSPRRRTMEISVTDSLQVKVVAPLGISEHEVRRFVSQKEGWISRNLKKLRRDHALLRSKKYADGHAFLFLGEKYKLKLLERKIRRPRIIFDGVTLLIHVPVFDSESEIQESIKAKLVQWYRSQAQEIFGGRVFHFSRILGIEPLKIAIRTQKRIWGSCGYHEKTISLNWQLIMAPREVIDYVIVHDLCHLKIPNHSRKYWKKVGQILPDYKLYQRWLRVNRADMILP